jgi:hypothetical protein
MFLKKNPLKQGQTKICSLIHNFSQSCQQDAHEFVNSIIGDMSNIIKDNLKIEGMQFCLRCYKAAYKLERFCNKLVINLQPGLTHLSIQTVIANIFLSEDIQFYCAYFTVETCHKVRKV